MRLAAAGTNGAKGERIRAKALGHGHVTRGRSRCAACVAQRSGETIANSGAGAKSCSMGVAARVRDQYNGASAANARVSGVRESRRPI